MVLQSQEEISPFPFCQCHPVSKCPSLRCLVQSCSRWNGRGDVTACTCDITACICDVISSLNKPMMSQPPPRTNPKKGLWLLGQPSPSSLL